jgi:hypothetical protein
MVPIIPARCSSCITDPELKSKSQSCKLLISAFSLTDLISDFDLRGLGNF